MFCIQEVLALAGCGTDRFKQQCSGCMECRNIDEIITIVLCPAGVCAQEHCAGGDS